jgi:poly-beta-1,6-N-acetyl-D-glucosamine synthase
MDVWSAHKSGIHVADNTPKTQEVCVNTTVLIPAHNEQATIVQAMESIDAQTVRATRKVVLADNCTDATAELARSRDGWECWESVSNRDKKAGALNQAAERLVNEDGYVLVMDADSRIASNFLLYAHVAMQQADVGAVGGVFYGDPGGGLVGFLQRNEYARYGRDIDRKRGKAMVLTGTASMFRVNVWRQIRESRGDSLPGQSGQVYDTLALTEDNEITIAVKTLGYRCVSPRQCVVMTEVMETTGDLWRQRMRWQRGAIENLTHYGWSKVTAPYIFQQSMMIVGIMSMALYLLLTVTSLGNGWTWHPFWLIVGGVFVLERMVTVRRRGIGAVAVASTLLIEWIYDMFLQVVLLRSIFDVAMRRTAEW